MEDENLDQTQESQEQLDQSTSEEQLNNEQSPEAEAEAPEQEAEVEADADAQQDEPELSPRQQKRVEQIENQAKEYKLNKILDRVQGVNQRPEQRQQQEPSSINYRDEIDAPDELYNKLEKDRSTYGDERYSEGQRVAAEQLQALEWKTNIKLDLPLVKDKLEKLDPEDSAAIDREYLMYSGFDEKSGTVRNPGISYADFVDAQIERAERLAANLQARAQVNIAKQAANQGVRPDGGSRQGVTITNPGDIAKLSDKEFEKYRKDIYKQLGASLN